tara:strand:- start:140 stop:799 length:660 start_codon:yes stop_codon:yes gene_type:complete
MNILLDFDGIILRNENISKIIEEKSIDFVHKKLNKPYSKSKRINKFLYRTYGHTANGVAKYTSEKPEDVVLDYNNFVFDNINYQDISSYLTKEDKKRIDMLSHRSEISDHKFGLFTNAPLSWCENLFYHLDEDLFNMIDYNKVFTSDEGVLKPNISVYKNIENNLDNKIHFIDDSYINLLPVKDNKKWKTYLINSDTILDLIHIIERIHYTEILNLKRS